MKKNLISILSASVLVTFMDMILHGKILGGIYMETAALWRPMTGYNPSFTISTIIFSTVFVLAYNKLVSRPSVESGVKFGVWVGALLGVSMASSYCYMPIPEKLALGWFLISVIESVVIGATIGKLQSDD